MSRCPTELTQPARYAGFTLIELMITLVVATILVTVAVPAYMSEMRKSRRTEARSAILDIAGREERFLSVSGSYSNVPTDVGYAGTTWGAGEAVGSGYYTVAVTTTVATATTPPGYVVTANVVATGPQAGDTACQTFTVNQLGQQQATGTDANANVDCWQ
jgi:type IV pilus assembly protein PilE